MAVWLVEDVAHSVCLSRAPIWRPSRGGDTREAGGRVAESLVAVARKRGVVRFIGRVSTRFSEGGGQLDHRRASQGSAESLCARINDANLKVSVKKKYL